MAECLSDDDFQPPKKRTRFALPSTSKELMEASKGVLPKNTEKNDLWAFRAFDEWVSERNAVCKEEDRCPADILRTIDAGLLGKWLSLFVMEVRKNWYCTKTGIVVKCLFSKLLCELLFC